MKFLTLRTYLLLLATIPLLLVAVAISAILVPRYIVDLREAHQSRSAALAEQMRQAAGFALFIGDAEQLQQLADGLLKSDPMVRGVWLRDADSRLVGKAETPSADAGDSTIDMRWFSLSIAADAPSHQALISEFDQQPVRPPMTLGQIDIQYDDAAFRRAYQELMWVGGLAALFAVLMGGAFALVLARRISQPLLAVSDAVSRISQGELNARAMPTDRSTGGVLAPLVSGVNAMAQNLESMQDILHWRIAEATAELRSQKESAERATADKTRFLAAASHDLRQPLQALGLFVHRLHSVRAAPERRVLQQRIAETVAALQTLFASLLDLSSLETRKIAVSPRHFAAVEVLQPLVERYRPLAEQKNLTLRLRDGQHWVFADPALVERVMMNLLNNAIKYTDHGSVLLACRRRGGKLRLEVRDSGIGIAQDNHYDIFQEFVQLDNPARDPGKGMGIGLSVCRALATAMDTRLGVRSRIGLGSVFWIDLPLGEAAAVEAETKPLDSHAPPLILLLENHCVGCAKRAQQVAAWGFEVLQADDATAAEPALRALSDGRRPAAILCCEQLMQGTAGEALTRLLATLADAALPRPLLIAMAEAGGSEASTPAWAGQVDARLSATAPAGRLRAVLDQLLRAETATEVSF